MVKKNFLLEAVSKKAYYKKLCANWQNSLPVIHFFRI